MKRLDDGRVQRTMSWHLKEGRADEVRDQLDARVHRIATKGSYHVEKGWVLWKVVKKWFPHANGNQILGSSEKG